MSTDDLDQELEAFAERVDRAFAATTPPPGFQADLLRRVRSPRRWAWPELNVSQIAGIAAAFVVVLGAGLLLIHPSRPGGGSAATSAAAPAVPGAARAQNGSIDNRVAPRATSWGAVPRPQVAPGPVGAAPGRVTATLALPATAIVQRYAEPSAQDADGFASAMNARAATVPGNPGLIATYSGAGFSLSIFPTNASQGVEPSFVLTPQGSEPNGSGPAPAAAQAAAQQFLARFNLVPASPTRTDVTATPNAPTVVRYVTQVDGHDLVSTDGAPLGLAVVVEGDGSVFQANGPLPVLKFESSAYPLTPFADLARLAAAATESTLDHAALVYVLAFDGQQGFGYLEPAVLFTGSGKSVLVPAVAAARMR